MIDLMVLIVVVVVVVVVVEKIVVVGEKVDQSRVAQEVMPVVRIV